MTAWSFTYPFFTGLVGGVATPSDSGPVTRTVPNTIRLDGYTYGIDTKDYRHSSQDTFRDSVVANDQPNDTLFNAQGSWARYRYSWHRGAGQEVADFDDEADPFRFDGSRGLDPWTEHELTMLHDVTLRSAAMPTGDILLLRVNATVYAANGTTLYTATGTLNTWTATTSAAVGTIQALATDGTDLYVAGTTGLTKFVNGATVPTAFGTPVGGNCTSVGFVANRLLVGVDNLLKEVGTSGAVTTVYTHFQSAFRWNTIFNLGSRIYCGGYTGSRSELYTLTTDSTGALVRGQEAAPFPVAELLNGAVAYGGAVLLLTSNGVRFAQIGADGTLTYGPLITDIGSCLCGVADGRFAWVGASNMAPSSAGGLAGDGLVRLALDEFAGVLQPAYATDVAVAAASANVTGVARLGTAMAFGVKGAGIYVEDPATYITSAFITSGRFYFGTVEPKRLVDFKITWRELPACTINVYITDQADSLIGFGTSTPGSEELVIDLNGAAVDWLTVEVTIDGDGASTPLIDMWRIRAYPAPPTVEQWLLPIINFQQVVINDTQGEPVGQDPLEVRDRLLELWTEKRQVTYSEGDRTYRVRVDGFEVRPAKWTDDGKYLQSQFVLKLVSA